MTDQLLRKAAEASKDVRVSDHHRYRWRVTTAEFAALERTWDVQRPGGFWPAMGPEGSAPTVQPTLFGIAVVVDDAVGEMTLEGT